MKTYSILGEPMGEVFEALLGLAIDHCSTLQLVVRPSLGLSDKGSALLGRLQALLIEKLETARWPGTVLMDETATLWRFRFNADSARIVTEAQPRLYWTQPQLPEDLSLLRMSGEPWLVTIAHERDAYLCLEEDERLKLQVRLPELLLTEEKQGD